MPDTSPGGQWWGAGNMEQRIQCLKMLIREYGSPGLC